MITLTIDGQTVEVQEGTTVLRAAEQLGVEIPTLCDHPHLTPYGGCRLCVVEVQGFRVPVASCTLPAANGMVVQTNTEKIKSARRFVLSMLFSERNHFCPFCQVSGGDCTLQNHALEAGMTHWPLQPTWSNFPVDTSHKYFVLDNNRCILCRRCVRACAEMSGNFTLSVAERGAKSIVVADYNVPLGDSTCVACGSCVEVCPTGALIDRTSAYQGQGVSMTEIPSVCVGCSVGCGIVAETRDNRLVRISSGWDSPVNHGTLCKEGRYLPTDEERQRITTPMMKKNGKLEPVSWDEALAAVAEHLKPLAGKAKDGVAAMASTRLPAEDLALFREIFGEKLGSDMVTSVEEGFTTAALSKLAKAKGESFEADLDALEAADCVILVGADLAKHHGVVGFMVKRALPKGMKLVVIDPNENSFHSMANFALKIKEGADLTALAALEAGMAGKSTEAKSLAEKAGLKAEDIAGVTDMLRTVSAPIFVMGKSIASQPTTEALEALLRLAASCNAKVLSVKGKANSLAAAQYGLDKAFALNGHKAAFVALGDDFASQHMIQKLEKAPYLVVQTAYASRLTGIADVVLPVANWAEQEGHYLNLEGRLQKTEKLVEAPEGVRTTNDSLADLATRMGLRVTKVWKDDLAREIAPVAVTL
jgi:formate dehydrogenase major subunit